MLSIDRAFSLLICKQAAKNHTFRSAETNNWLYDDGTEQLHFGVDSTRTRTRTRTIEP